MNFITIILFAFPVGACIGGILSAIMLMQAITQAKKPSQLELIQQETKQYFTTKSKKKRPY